MEAKTRVDKAVAKWVEQGERRELKAEMAAAESLYSHALTYQQASQLPIGQILLRQWPPGQGHRRAARARNVARRASLLR